VNKLEMTSLSVVVAALPSPAGGTDTLDWDMHSEPKSREKHSILVTLSCVGRGKPIPDLDPWS